MSNLHDHLQALTPRHIQESMGEAADLDCDHAEVFQSEDENNR